MMKSIQMISTLLFSLLMVNEAAHAAPFKAEGRIVYSRYHTQVDWHYFQIKGVTSLGKCKSFDAGVGEGSLVVFGYMESDTKLHEWVMAAQLANLPIIVYGNDDIKIPHGECRARFIGIHRK